MLRKLDRDLFLKLVALFVALAAFALVPDSATPAPSQPANMRPVIFVHGGAGSAAQFQTQAQRLASNGYDDLVVVAFDYDSSFATETMAEVHQRLDDYMKVLKAALDVDQVDLLGHSLGTRVSQEYLNSSPERAAKVAHYVNIDGFPATAPPGGVDTLAIWADSNQGQQIQGAENIYLPDQSHVQAATSAETFAAFYEFFTGTPPTTTDVVPDEDDTVQISGEANIFPQNTGVGGATLDVWEVDAQGNRVGDEPVATDTVHAEGGWGPFELNNDLHYEFALSREVDGTRHTHHFYQPSFIRDDDYVRLLTSEPGTGIDGLRDKSDTTTTVTVVRYKEFWGDQADPALNDELRLNGENLINATNTPRSKRTNAIFLQDDGLDGQTNLAAPIQDVTALPFVTGLDVNIPAATPPNDTVELVNLARDGDDEVEVPDTVRFPNWASATHHVSVQFRDFEQEGDGHEHDGHGGGDHHGASTTTTTAPPASTTTTAPPGTTTTVPATTTTAPATTTTTMAPHDDHGHGDHGH
jgi:pimeloyl-ACP methyl ester carboxylesterase